MQSKEDSSLGSEGKPIHAELSRRAPDSVAYKCPVCGARIANQTTLVLEHCMLHVERRPYAGLRSIANSTAAGSLAQKKSGSA
jgi:hypothetical protein